MNFSKAQIAKIESLENVNDTKRKDVSQIDPRLIIIPRDENGKSDINERGLENVNNGVEELASSIEENGIIQPLTVYSDKIGKQRVYILIDGERRMTATNLLLERGVNVARVPALVVPKPSPEELIFRMIISNDGLPMTTLEEGEAFLKLTNLGWTPGEIAAKVGRTQGHLSNALTLAKAPKTIKNRIVAGEISSSEALKVLRENVDATEAAKVVDEAVETAKAEGKTKATAKHVKTKKTKDVFVFVDENGEVNVFANFKGFNVKVVSSLDELPQHVNTVDVEENQPA